MIQGERDFGGERKSPEDLHAELRGMFDITPPSVDVEHKQIARKYDPMEKFGRMFLDSLVPALEEHGISIRSREDPEDDNFLEQRRQERPAKESLLPPKPKAKKRLWPFSNAYKDSLEEFDYEGYNKETAEHDAEVLKSRTNAEINDPLRRKLEEILSPQNIIITSSYRNKIIEQYFHFRFSGLTEGDVYQTHRLRELYTELGLGDSFGVGIFDGNPIERERATYRRLREEFDFLKRFARKPELESINIIHMLSQSFPKSGIQSEVASQEYLDNWAREFEALYGREA